MSNSKSFNYDPVCGKNYKESNCSTLRKCFNYFDIIKPKAI